MPFTYKPYNDLPATRAAAVSYTGHFLSSLDSLDCTNGSRPSTPAAARDGRGRLSVDVISQLPLRVVSYNGGDHGSAYAVSNLVSPHNNVYCARKNHCDVVLAVDSGSSGPGAQCPMIKEINIVAPPQKSYTAPVQNVAVFVAMAYDAALVPRANEYIENSPVSPLFNAKAAAALTPRTYSTNSPLPGVPGAFNPLFNTPWFNHYITQALGGEEDTQQIPRDGALSGGSTRVHTGANTPAQGRARVAGAESKEEEMERTMRENIALFERELGPSGNAARIQDMAEPAEHVVATHYHLCNPKYKCDPLTLAQELDLAPRRLRVRRAAATEDDDEDADTRYCRGAEENMDQPVDSYTVRTVVSETRWQSSGELRPIALATIPSGTGEYRHLRIRFEEGVMGRYLVVKFSNTTTRGDANVDIESLTVHGVESEGHSFEMV